MSCKTLLFCSHFECIFVFYVYCVTCSLKPPSMLRRQKIEEISSDFSKKLNAWELYAELFTAGTV